MTTLEVTVRHADGTTEQRELSIARIANCGGTWREPPTGEALATLREARGPGFDPEELIVTPKPRHLVTTATEIQVNATTTGGETEFVLFPTAEGTYLGVGMDHKDFAVVEDGGIHRGNSTCPSVVADEVWPLDDVVDHWDDLVLRSWTGRGGERERYQEAPLSAFLEPRDLLDRVDDLLSEPVEGTAVWSGTVGAVDDEVQGVNPAPSVRSGDYFAVELHDPVENRRLATQYDVRPNDWVAAVDL